LRLIAACRAPTGCCIG